MFVRILEQLATCEDGPYSSDDVDECLRRYAISDENSPYRVDTRAAHFSHLTHVLFDLGLMEDGEDEDRILVHASRAKDLLLLARMWLEPGDLRNIRYWQAEFSFDEGQSWIADPIRYKAPESADSAALRWQARGAGAIRVVTHYPTEEVFFPKNERAMIEVVRQLRRDQEPEKTDTTHQK